MTELKISFMADTINLAAKSIWWNSIYCRKQQEKKQWLMKMGSWLQLKGSHISYTKFFAQKPYLFWHVKLAEFVSKIFCPYTSFLYTAKEQTRKTLNLTHTRTYTLYISSRIQKLIFPSFKRPICLNLQWQ